MSDQPTFIVRLRSPQGLIRINVTGEERWNTIIANLPARYDISQTYHTLVRCDDMKKTDLLASYTNGQTLAQQGVQHGALFYLEPRPTSTRPTPISLGTRINQSTRILTTDLPVSSQSLSSKPHFEPVVDPVTSSWSHVAIFARIRGSFCPGSGVPTRTPTSTETMSL